MSSFEFHPTGPTAMGGEVARDSIGDVRMDVLKNARCCCSKRLRFRGVMCGLGTLLIVLTPAVLVICRALQHLRNPRDQYPFGLPDDIEFIYVRHGMSTMNAPLDVFNDLTHQACKCDRSQRLRPASSRSCKMPDEVCLGSNPIASDANKRAHWVNSTLRHPKVHLPTYLLKAASALLDNRMFFDAPLTKEGLQQAQQLHHHTSSLQLDWLREHESYGTRMMLQSDAEASRLKSDSASSCKMVLVSSNLVRAVDTLLNGFAHLADSTVPFFLHTALQEYSMTGNGDVVSMFLPLGLRNDSKTLASTPTWKEISQRRLESYKDAKLLGVPWASRGDFSNMSWWQRRKFSLASVYNSNADHLVNHDFFLPNSHIGEKYYREPPTADVETVRLGTEYESDKDLGPVRFNDFLRWAHALRTEQQDVKRMVIVGHGSWFRDFVAHSRRNGDLSDQSCARFGTDRLNNAAAVKIVNGRCVCLFNGADREETCIGPRR